MIVRFRAYHTTVDHTMGTDCLEIRCGPLNLVGGGWKMEAKLLTQDDGVDGTVAATAEGCFHNACNATVGPPRASTQPANGTVKSHLWCDNSILHTMFGLSDDGWFNESTQLHECLTAHSAVRMELLSSSVVEFMDVLTPS